MSLIRDYLEKTTPQAGQGREEQVPPMLRREGKKGPGGVKRLMPAALLLLMVLLFSGYIFKTSFQDLPGQAENNYAKGNTNRQTSPDQAGKARSNQTAKPTPDLKKRAVVSQLPGENNRKPETTITPVKSSVPEIEKIQEQPKTTKVQGTKTGAEKRLQMAMEGMKLKTAQASPQPFKNSTHPATDAVPLTNEKAEETRQEKTIATGELKSTVSGQVIRTGPDDYFNLGLAAQKAGNPSQAMGFYRKTLMLKSDHSGALLNLSVIHINLGNDRRAMTLLNKLHALEPENVDAMVNLGILLTRGKKYDKAQAVFEKALDIQGHNAKALFNLAYLNQVRNHLERARELYTRVASLDRDNTKAFLAAASILEKQQKFSHALGCYIQALDTTMVKNSSSFRQKIETRIRLLHKIEAETDQREETKI